MVRPQTVAPLWFSIQTKTSLPPALVLLDVPGPKSMVCSKEPVTTVKPLGSMATPLPELLPLLPRLTAQASEPSGLSRPTNASSRPALFALMAEWGRQDEDDTTRLDQVRHGGG